MSISVTVSGQESTSVVSTQPLSNTITVSGLTQDVTVTRSSENSATVTVSTGDPITVTSNFSNFVTGDVVRPGEISNFVTSSSLSDLNTATGVLNASVNNLNTATGLLVEKSETGLFLTSGEINTNINNAVANLVDSAPSTLDTLNELAAALGDDANFSTTTAASLGNLSTATGVLNTNVIGLQTATGSLKSDILTNNALIASNASDITSLREVTGDIFDATGLLSTATGNLDSKIITVSGLIVSNDTDLTDLNTATGLLNTATGVLNTNVLALQAVSGSFAQTGSGTFGFLNVTGTVGIGTSSVTAGHKLEVNGDIKASNINAGEIDSAGGDGYSLEGLKFAKFENHALQLGDWDGENFSTKIYGNGLIPAINITGNQTTAGTFVGIGTTNPTKKLEVAGGPINSLGGGLITGRLGVGTNTTGAAALTVDAGATNSVAKFVSTDDKAVVQIKDNSTDAHLIAKDDLLSIGNNTTDFSKFNVNISNGDVGIGTTSPATKLHVNGNITGSIISGTIGAMGYLFTTGGIGIGLPRPSVGGNGGDVFAVNGNSTFNGNFVIKQGNEGSLDIDTNQYNYKFGDISGGENQSFLEIDSQSAATTLHNSSLKIVDTFQCRDLIASGFTTLSGTAFVTGRVGIGTNSPDTQLHIKSAGDVAMKLEADTDNTNENDNPLIQFTQDSALVAAEVGFNGDAGAAFTNSLINAFYIESNSSAGAAHQHIQFATNNKAQLTITDDKIGIGTKSPQEKLHVDGNTILSGVLTVTGNINGKLGSPYQPNITQVGTLTGLRVGTNSSQEVAQFNIETFNVSAGAGDVSIQNGNISAASGLFTNISGALTTAVQPNITSLGTLTGLRVASAEVASFNVDVFSVAGSNLVLDETQLNIGSAAGNCLAINDNGGGTNFINANINNKTFSLDGDLRVIGDMGLTGDATVSGDLTVTDGNIEVGKIGENIDRKITIHSQNAFNKRADIGYVGGVFGIRPQIGNQTFVFGDTSINDMRFRSNAGAGVLKFETANSERIRVASDGNVGIGTTSPNANLHVSGDTILSGDATVGKITLSENSFVTETGNFTLGSTHRGATVLLQNTSPITVTVPSQVSGHVTTFIAETINDVTFATGVGISGLNSFNGANSMLGQFAQAQIIFKTPEYAFLGGQIT